MTSVLVGDIGGTKTVLAIAYADQAGWRLQAQQRYTSRDFPDLTTLLRTYLTTISEPIQYAALAIAAPIDQQRCQTTNLPWTIDAAGLAQQLGLNKVWLLNDLEAQAWGLPELPAAGRICLYEGLQPTTGHAAIVAAGTGLGVAGLHWDGDHYRPFATESGHSDFAASNEQDWMLYQQVQQEFDHVSWERIVSGPGIFRIYQSLCQQRGVQFEPPVAAAHADEQGDPSATIARHASDETCPICHETMTLFMSLYGRIAGNIALTHLTFGGIYLGGGIAPANLDCVQQGSFMAGFLNKGRMRQLVERIPVYVIVDSTIPLLGAAAFFNQVTR
jgi:glucokinase